MLNSNSAELVAFLSQFPDLQVTTSSEMAVPFYGVEFDSRELKGGELFVALPGEATHGNRFVEQALFNGAAVCLVEDVTGTALKIPKSEDSLGRVVSVKDTLRAFSLIANWWRKKLNTPILGVTGSVGKTTVKELMAQILTRVANGCWTRKSYNNHVGVPYTLCHLSREHAWAVVEMGMNHTGELSKLSRIAEPDLVLITCIAPVHIEFFKDLHGIAAAKLEILAGLRPGGSVLLNFDDEILMSAYQRFSVAAEGSNLAEALAPIGFSSISRQATVKIGKLRSHGLQGLSFDLELKGQVFALKLPLIGRHNAMNLAAAILGAISLQPELEIERLVALLPELKLPNMRLTVHNLSNGRTVVDDSYNASPKSMRALVDLLTESRDSQQIIGLVLGDMKELGSQAKTAHHELGELVAVAGINFIIAVGEWASELVSGCARSGIKQLVCKDAAAALNALRELGDQEFKFDILGVKASRSVGLDLLVQGLLKDDKRSVIG